MATSQIPPTNHPKNSKHLPQQTPATHDTKQNNKNQNNSKLKQTYSVVAVEHSLRMPTDEHFFFISQLQFVTYTLKTIKEGLVRFIWVVLKKSAGLV
mmetsp:Transcript_2827/g.5364  ORF Transcript_2827/g.5364 Transcript_2827/m.5364 type:complete len:97 (-) Transcript_2827:553-843(-)